MFLRDLDPYERVDPFPVEAALLEERPQSVRELVQEYVEGAMLERLDEPDSLDLVSMWDDTEEEEMVLSEYQLAAVAEELAIQEALSDAESEPAPEPSQGEKEPQDAGQAPDAGENGSTPTLRGTLPGDNAEGSS